MSIKDPQELLARYASGERDFTGASLPNTNLSGSSLGGANLNGADLNKANLYKVNLSGSFLRGANLERANLSGADLNKANLYKVNLIEANLRNANLAKAFLPFARLGSATFIDANLDGAFIRAGELIGAYLQNASMIRTDLGFANLSSANLAGANLSGGELQAANLRGARLDNARLHGARVGDTLFACELLGAMGLEDLIHESPSHLSTVALAQCNGKLPIAFLRGCGLSDWEIASARLYDPTLSNTAISELQYQIFELRARRAFQIAPVFISYSWTDDKFVDQLGTLLDDKGVRYWRDKHSATAGPLDKVIDRGMSLQSAVILVLSKSSVNSPWVEYEVDKAVELARKRGQHVLCPIALDHAWLDSSSFSGQLRAQIKKYNVLDLSEWSDPETFDRQCRRLLEGLEAHYSEPGNAPRS